MKIILQMFRLCKEFINGQYNEQLFTITSTKQQLHVYVAILLRPILCHAVMNKICLNQTTTNRIKCNF